ncbi:MAG TPA: DEAD/DEAH box helicase [Candidatus Aquilonibacter sp.]|nr:DEAD/DEAH box helicase [Candidatus Aquilonibacter sp.]
MIAMLDEQRAAVEAPLHLALAITGASGTGKSTALRARYERTIEHDAANARYLTHPEQLRELAVEILGQAGAPVTLVDDVEAEWTFTECAKPIFALEWAEFVAGAVDPEVPGLRSPDRFATAAFRLFRKLRDSAIGPQAFLERALRGATSFYGKPPNFAHPELILATKDAYRDSLDVTTEELGRQYRHEVDLAKVLAQLYTEYVREVRQSRRMTGRDAIAEAIELLASDDALRSATAIAASPLFIDEAQEATTGMRALLEALYGPALERVTIAGDPAGATSTFRGARPEGMFSGFTTIELRQQHRNPIAVEIACGQLSRSYLRTDAKNVPPALELHRAKSEADEARYIAHAVRNALDEGTQPRQIALLFRSTGDVHAYEEALLELDIPVSVSGDVNIFEGRRALDALALLWNVWDPFRHDYLIRSLSGPAFALADASIVTLCSEPADAQTALFAMDDEPAPTARSGRWDPKRDLRLGWNVLRGDQDDSLNPVARERIERFRELRAGWVEAMQTLPFAQFARRVWSEGLARDGRPGSARALAQQLVLRRLLARLRAFEAQNPGCGTGSILAYADARRESRLESCEADGDERFVQLLSIDAARGREFDVVIVPDARAGSFPRWYVPDSFLFSPAAGMVPKDNVGDARASRTAKFSYYLFKTKAREAYNDEERRAFVYALRRTKRRAIVTASGKATRGTTAPEFFEELRNARLPGSVVDDAR